LIGTSKNLAVNEVLNGIQKEAKNLLASGDEYPAITQALANTEPFTLFEFTGLGLCLLAVGALYFLGPGLRLLPRKREEESLTEHYHVREFVTEMLVKPSSTLINRSMGDAEFLKDHDVTVLGIVRPDETSILAPGPYNRIQSDDTLVLQGEPDAILKIRRDLDLQDAGSVDVGGTRLHSGDVALIEAVIPPGSTLVGQSLSGSEFQEHSGLNVIALSKGGKLQGKGIRQARLNVGDTLLLQGHLRDIERAKRDRELLILEQKELQPIGRGGLITVLTLAVVLIVAFVPLMKISVAAIAGALFLVATRVVQPREVYQAMDWTALILIGGMLALGKAFQVTGLAGDVGLFIQGLAGEGVGNHMLIGLFLVLTGVLTQLTTHIASAVIMAPIAVSTAAGLGISDRPFLMAVLSGASLAFMSPVAHQANTMVMGPGDYRYKDFLRAGTPLTIIEYIAAFFLIPVLFPFG
jgi:di/tricarboxylate transporter